VAIGGAEVGGPHEGERASGALNRVPGVLGPVPLIRGDIHAQWSRRPCGSAPEHTDQRAPEPDSRDVGSAAAPAFLTKQHYDSMVNSRALSGERTPARLRDLYNNVSPPNLARKGRLGAQITQLSGVVGVTSSRTCFRFQVNGSPPQLD